MLEATSALRIKPSVLNGSFLGGLAALSRLKQLRQGAGNGHETHAGSLTNGDLGALALRSCRAGEYYRVVL